MFNATQILNLNLNPVNSLFAHWIKEIDILKYGTKQKPFANDHTTTDLHVFGHHAKTFTKTRTKNDWKKLFLSKIPVNYSENSDWRIFNSGNNVQRTGESLEDRIANIGQQIDSKYVYRIPLKYSCDLGKINFRTEIDMKVCCTLKTEMKKQY